MEDLRLAIGDFGLLCPEDRVAALLIRPKPARSSVPAPFVVPVASQSHRVQWSNWNLPANSVPYPRRQLLLTEAKRAFNRLAYQRFNRVAFHYCVSDCGTVDRLCAVSGDQGCCLLTLAQRRNRRGYGRNGAPIVNLPAASKWQPLCRLSDPLRESPMRGNHWNSADYPHHKIRVFGYRP